MKSIGKRFTEKKKFITFHLQNVRICGVGLTFAPGRLKYFRLFLRPNYIMGSMVETTGARYKRKRLSNIFPFKM